MTGIMPNEENKIFRSEEFNETETPLEKIVEYRDIRGSYPISYMQAFVVTSQANVGIGDGKYFFHVDKNTANKNLVEVHAEVLTAGTTNTTDIQIANVTQSADMLTTKITIDSAETGSDTGTAAVIDPLNDDVAENDLLRIDVDAVSTTPPKGLIITLGFASLGQNLRKQ